MIYLVGFVIAVLVIFNLYVSIKVLRDGFSTRTQKLLQLGFIWLLPIIGGVIASSLVGGTGHPTVDLSSGKAMEFEDYWRSPLDGETSATDHSTSDHSCD